MRGKIFLIEGTDGSGKATQSKKLLDRLNSEGTPCQVMSFPQYDTPTGRIIGQCYLGKAREDWSGEGAWFGEADKLDPKIASLYYAIDRFAASEKITRTIQEGNNLILDRYYPSNMAHQGGKIRDPKEREELFSWLEKLEFELLGIPREDLTIFLHMPTDVAVELRKRRDLKNGTIQNYDGHETNIGHLRRAEETYMQLAKKYGWEMISCAPDGTIDTLRSLEDIHEEVYAKIRARLNL